MYELSLIPHVDEIELAGTQHTGSNAWEIISQCAINIKVLSKLNQSTTTNGLNCSSTAEDAHLLLLCGGFEAYQQRIKTPLVNSTVVAACQCVFQKALQKSWEYDTNAAHIFSSNKDKDNISCHILDVRTESIDDHSVSTFFSLVTNGLLLDFPAIRLQTNE